jgi:hypothetical protein
MRTRAAALSASLAVVLATFAVLIVGGPPSSAAVDPSVTKVLTFVEENHSLAQMEAGMPYAFGLAQQYGYADNWTAITHPSLPNYVAIASGKTYGIVDDKAPSSHKLAGPSVFGQTVTAGKTAKLYAEGETKNCMLTNTGQYAVKHNPWAYFVDSTERTPCNTNDVPTTKLDADITAGTLPVTGMVVPNLVDDGHDGTLAAADNWFKAWMLKIFAGPDWASGRLAVVLTADEDDKLSGNKVLTVVIHPAVSTKVVSTPLTHYSLTRFYEDVAGTSRLNGAATATDMAADFGLYPGIAPPPTTTAPTTTAPTTTAPTTTAPTTEPTTTTPPTTEPTTTVPTTTEPTTTAPTTTTPPPPPPKWTLAYSDGFDGTDLDPAIWRKYGEGVPACWPGHSNNGLRCASAVTVENGAAVITAKEVNNVIQSGAFTVRDTSGLYSQYGKFEARIKVDPDPSGVMSAVALTWPTDNNSCAGGENDFYETGRQRLNWKTYIHYNCGSQVSYTHLHDPLAWHLIRFEWEPDLLAVYVDDVLEGSWTDPGVIPDWVHRLTFQYDAFATDMGATVTKMYVDDVKIWKLTTPNATPASPLGADILPDELTRTYPMLHWVDRQIYVDTIPASFSAVPGVDQIQALGMTGIISIDHPGTDTAAMAAFAATVPAGWRIKLSNEPDNDPTHFTGPTWVAMVNSMGHAIKTVNPAVIVVSGSLMRTTVQNNTAYWAGLDWTAIGEFGVHGYAHSFNTDGTAHAGWPYTFAKLMDDPSGQSVVNNIRTSGWVGPINLDESAVEYDPARPTMDRALWTFDGLKYSASKGIVLDNYWQHDIDPNSNSGYRWLLFDPDLVRLQSLISAN